MSACRDGPVSWRIGTGDEADEDDAEDDVEDGDGGRWWKRRGLIASRSGSMQS